ncbi:MAG: NADH-quinone oxidoreductase subunit N, partial [Pseudomonas sp.]|nr:NADH-quinone oxidoreductase subunit N [Pseudomonas sp.]
SLAGIPLTAGFIGKFYIVATGVQSHLWWLLGTMVIGSAIGVFYYLRVMVTLFLVAPGLHRHDAPENWGQRTGGIMLMAMAILTLALGVYPQPLLQLLQHTGLAAL